MKKDSPISLFSFQDIITCLTGIMIVVVLVILLQLVNATENYQTSTDSRPQMDSLIEKQRELSARLAKLKSSSFTAEIPQLASLSAEDLNTILQAAKEKQQELKQQQQRQLNETARLHNSAAKNQQSINNEQAELDALAAKMSQQERLQRQAEALRRQKEYVEKLIAQKKKSLSFEFTGSSNTPIIVECNSWGFRAQKYPDGRIQTFGTPGKTNQKDHVNELIRFIKKHKNCYPLLIFRQDAIKYVNDLEIKIENSIKGISIGKEPLAAGEECFYNE